jgi:hypothetical protein
MLQPLQLHTFAKQLLHQRNEIFLMKGLEDGLKTGSTIRCEPGSSTESSSDQLKKLHQFSPSDFSSRSSSFSPIFHP